MVTTSISLLDRLRRSGDSEAWGRFVDVYTPLIFYSVKKLGLPPDDVPDVVQDIFVLLLKKLPSFEYQRGDSFRAWLSVIARNKCIDVLRKRRPIPVGSASDGHLAPDNAELITDREYNNFVTRRALELMRSEFSENAWRACWEHVVEGRPAAEIAEQLGMTVNAVYIAKSRVLRRLREELAHLLG